MMIYGILRTAIAVTGMCFLVSVPAQTATIGEALDIMGDTFVLENLCPELYKNVDAILAHMEQAGVTESMMTDTNIYSDELEAAAKRSLAIRKHKTREENCMDAIELYGSNGTRAKGQFLQQTERGKVK